MNLLPHYGDRVATTIIAESITNNDDSMTNVIIEKQKAEHEILPDNDLTVRALQHNPKLDLVWRHV